ncbi:MAG: hypothetical protein ACI9EW_000957 [Cellvibrionaceae bacterium]|jgi:hypothetical protein
MNFRNRLTSFFQKKTNEDKSVSAEDIQLFLNGLTQKIKNRVPKEIFGVVNSIKESILLTLPQIEDITSGEPHIYSIRRTALSYLPESLDNYLNLPTSHARFHVIRDDKTATDILLEQLNLLDKEMKEILVDFQQNNVHNLLVHGRFLASKFKEPDILKTPDQQ